MMVIFLILVGSNRHRRAACRWCRWWANMGGRYYRAGPDRTTPSTTTYCRSATTAFIPTRTQRLSCVLFNNQPDPNYRRRICQYGASPMTAYRLPTVTALVGGAMVATPGPAGVATPAAPFPPPHHQPPPGGRPLRQPLPTACRAQVCDNTPFVCERVGVVQHSFLPTFCCDYVVVFHLH